MVSSILPANTPSSGAMAGCLAPSRDDVLPSETPASDLASPPSSNPSSNSTANSPDRFLSTSSYSLTAESFHLKYQTQDGDLLELSSTSLSYTAQSTFSKDPNRNGQDLANLLGDQSFLQKMNDVGSAEGQKKARGPFEQIMQVMNEARKQFRNQQLEVVKALLGKDGDAFNSDFAQGLWAKLSAAQKANDNSETTKSGSQEGQQQLIVVMEESHLHVAVSTSQSSEAQPTDGSVPEYWNAENTANRIVDFAMQFAGLHGDDAEGFAQQIRDAVAKGFAQAHALTGDLPGEAGKLNKSTFNKTFEKLDQQLADWKSAPYNQDSTSPTSPAPVISALPALGLLA